MNAGILDAIFFDFDGVILESVNVKTDAFAALFADWPVHVDSILKMHVENGGVSRFKKFKIIHEEIIGLPYDDIIEETLAGKFSNLVLEKVLACPFVFGAEEFLKEWSERLPMYVVSGTPTGEMREIVERRGLGYAFREIYGAPEKKDYWIRKILAEKGYRAEACRMVGDAGADMKAARAAGVPFVGRVTPGEFNPFENETEFPKIDDLTNLATVIGLKKGIC